MHLLCCLSLWFVQVQFLFHSCNFYHSLDMSHHVTLQLIYIYIWLLIFVQMKHLLYTLKFWTVFVNLSPRTDRHAIDVQYRTTKSQSTNCIDRVSDENENICKMSRAQIFKRSDRVIRAYIWSGSNLPFGFFKNLNLVWDLFVPKKQDYPDPIRRVDSVVIFRTK